MDNNILWIEKYQPRSLKDLSYNKDIAENLKELVEAEDFPHLLFYGSNGAGKRTLIHCLLRELYGSKTDRVKGEVREFEKSGHSSGKVECTVISSAYHIEVTPSEAGTNDKYVVQRLIKEMAGSHVIALQDSTRNFKIVVINEVDYLTRDAQAGLRRTMEKYMSNCRILMNCQCISKVIDPLRSRCLLVRVPAPSNTIIESICKTITTKESSNVSKERLKDIVNRSKRNLRRAIMMLQTFAANDNRGPVPVPHYESFTHEIADSILMEQSPRKLKEVREKFNDLLVKLVPPREILWILLTDFLRKLKKDIHEEISAAAALYDYRAQLGTKAVMHLEAFTAKVMAIIKISESRR